MSARGRRQRKSLTVNTDLKLMPLMIETSLPRDSDAATAAAPAPETVPLDLAVHVRADVYVVEGHGVGPLLIARKPGTAAPDSLTALELTHVLQNIVAAHPGTTDIRIVAESHTRYQEVISLMDAARAAGLLSPALEGSSPEDV